MTIENDAREVARKVRNARIGMAVSAGVAILVSTLTGGRESLDIELFGMLVKLPNPWTFLFFLVVAMYFVAKVRILKGEK